MGSLFDRIAGLPLQVDGYRLERRELGLVSFVRVSTVIHLLGGGEEGLGEDVTYEEPDQTLFQREGTAFDLSGSCTLQEFSAKLDDLSLFAAPPRQEASRDFRRWAFESAALDLALRQGGRSLADLLGREMQPLRFIVSMSLGHPPSLEPIRAVQALHPEMHFKLDPTSDWNDAFAAAVDAAATVDVVDLKSFYSGTPVDQPVDLALYRRICETFPDAWIEDPAWRPDTVEILQLHRERVTWDAPIHSVADVERLPHPPRTLNIKPSRFGTLQRLFAAYDHCESRGIAMYGGGQFELGPGRGQIQYLASMFHPDAPNDVAPGEYHPYPPSPDAPASPLPPAAAPIGFRWGGQ